jgi:quercetin dioxygenase-like cupin family protein
MGRAVRDPTQRDREVPAAARVRPSELADYRTSAVASRTLLQHAAATITVFAFDVGQGLTEHRAPFDVVAHILEGEAQITVAGKPLQVPAGELVLIPANQPHAVYAVTKFKMLLTMVRT